MNVRRNDDIYDIDVISPKVPERCPVCGHDI